MTTAELIELSYESDRSTQVKRLEALIVRIKAEKKLDEAGGLDMDALSDAIGNLEITMNTPYGD